MQYPGQTYDKNYVNRKNKHQKHLSKLLQRFLFTFKDAEGGVLTGKPVEI